MRTVAFGGDELERVEIIMRGYECPRTGEWYDDNWISADVAVRAGSFRGKYSASFLTSELQEFLSSLKDLSSSLIGKATFETLEGQLSLALERDGMGHIRLEGSATDQSGIGNCLRFCLSLDQTQLSSSIEALENAVNEYPVRA